MLPRAIRITVVVLALLVTIGLIAAVVVWKTRQEAVADTVESFVQDFLIANDSTKIEISRVSGNPLGSVTLHDARLLVRDGDEWRTFMETRAATVKYRLSQLSRGGVRLESVQFVRPVVSFSRAANGEYLWPRFGDGSTSESEDVFAVAIDRVSVTEGRWTIESGDEQLLLQDISLEGAFSSDEDGLSLSGLTLSFFVEPWEYMVRECTGALAFRKGNVEVQNVDVRTTESSFTCDGVVGTGPGGAMKLDAVLREFSISEARSVEMLSFLPEQGAVTGTVRVRREEGGATRVESSLRGTYGAHLVESLDLISTVEGSRWRNEFRAKSDGSVVEGTFHLGRGEFQECSIDFMNLDPGSWPELVGTSDVPHGSVSGRFTFSGRLLTSPKREGRVGMFLYGGQYAGVSFLEGSATGNLTGDGGLVLSEINLVGAGYNLSGQGSVGGEGEISVFFSGSLTSLSEIAALEDALGLEGSLAVGGEVSGSGQMLSVDVGLAGNIRDTSPSVVSGQVKGIHVEGSLIPSVLLNATGVLGPVELAGIEFDSLVIQSVLKAGIEESETSGGKASSEYGSTVATLEAHMRGARGDTSFAAEATAAFCEEGTDVAIERFVGRLEELTWKNEKTIRVGWRGGVLRVEDLELSSEESRIELTGSYKPETDLIRGTLEVTSLDVGRLLGQLLPLGGKVDAHVVFNQEEAGPAVSAEIDWLDASVKDKLVDRASLSATASANELRIGKLELAKGEGIFRASGRVVLPSEIREFVDSVLSHRFVPSGVGADLDVNLTKLDLSDFSSWHPSLSSIGGVIDSRARVEGLLENPSIALRLNAKNLQVKEYTLTDLSADVVLADSVCTVSSVELLERDARGEIKGFFPVILDLSTARLSFPDAPLHLTVLVSESDFAVASLFVKQLASCSGVTRGEAELTGTLKNPTLRGGFELKDATLRMAGREERLEDLDARVVFSEEALELVSCTGRLGEGRVEANGGIFLSGDRRGQYEFDVKARKVTMGDPQDIALKADCALKISSVEVADRGTYAQITGRVDVRQGVIAREFQASSGPRQEQRWLCDIELEIPNNLWLKNTNAEIELAGSLTARKDISGLVLLGSLRILRGKYYVFDNEFRISSGTLEFKDVWTIDPVMNIEAETRASGRRIFLALTGKLSEPNIRLSSEDPNLSQTEIVRLLTVGKYVATEPGEGGEGGFVPGVTGSVGNYFLRQVERRLARDLRWVDSIELGSGMEGTGSLSELRWGVGKYITPEIYLRYSQGLTKTSERDVSVEYRLSELFFLRGEVVSRDRLVGRERDEYNLDLKLKYEY